MSAHVSSSKSSPDRIGLRFGVEIELVVRSKTKIHQDFNSLALEIKQHLAKAKIDSHIGNLTKKEDETYQDWTIIQDLTITSTPGTNTFGVELVSPILPFNDPKTWTTEIRTIWRVLRTNLHIITTPQSTAECSTHIHLSPATGHPFTLAQTKSLATAAIHFERCIDALMPPHRRVSAYCMSHRHNPRFHTLSMPHIFSTISRHTSIENLASDMCWCSKDSIHAERTMHDEDFEHPHFRWNFLSLLERKGTVEFRQPPDSRGAGDTVAWVMFAGGFVQWAVEWGSRLLEPGRRAQLVDLRVCVLEGARMSGVGERGMEVLEGLFSGKGMLPEGPRVDLKGVSEKGWEEMRGVAERRGMELKEYKELFGYQ